MSKPDSFSVVIPIYNEEANLSELIERSLKACRAVSAPFEIILVSDGSDDRSPELIAAAADANPGEIVGVFLNRNYGQHAAVFAGLESASGDVVITLDGDLQNPPEEIGKLYAKMSEGYDIVAGVRVPRRDSVFRRFFSYLTNGMTAKVTGVKMRDYGCMLRAYRWRVVKAMLECTERSAFIPVLANSFARRVTEIEVRHVERTGGKSKYDLWKLVNLQFDLLTGMTTFPLRLLTVVGVLIALVGLGFGGFLLFMRWLKGPEWAVQGVFTLFAILFIFVGAQFVGMGLLGEYVGRVYKDVRARPRYVVYEVKGRSRLKIA